MAEDRSYIEANNRERERLRALVDRLDDETLTAPVNEYWTVAGVLGHMAFWDQRVMVFTEKIERSEPWVPGDAEPEGDWLNDTTRPLIHAIAPRAAAQLALRTAEQTDARVAELPPDRFWPNDPDSPISAARWEHRAEHLDEIEAALRVSDPSVLRRLADDGSEEAERRLTELAVERGDLEQLRRLADDGSEEAERRLTELAVERGDLEQLRRLADGGNEEAERRLTELIRNIK